MKLAALLVVASWAAVSWGSPAEPSDEGVSQAAAAQLQRLAGFRRTEPQEQQKQHQDERRTRSSQLARKRPAEDEGLQLPIDWSELMRIFDEPGAQQGQESSKRQQQLSPDKMAKLDSYADKLLRDERVQSYVQERIKRDGYGYGGGGGSGGSNSGSFISGLAGQVVGSVVGLSSSASRGSSSSSHQPAPVYGPPSYQHGKEGFGFWDLKRAILNTLIQAAKAVGGGVLALKGQLIKGSGYVVSTKGRVISSAGEALTGLGKKIASQAVVAPPPAHYTPTHGYSYEQPISHTYGQYGHDTSYVGAPPSIDSYQSTYSAASNDVTFTDDGLQPGLLIAKPTGSNDIHSEPQHADHQVQSDPGQAPDYHYQHQQQQPQVEDPPEEDVDPRNPASHYQANGESETAGEGHAAVEESPSVPGNTLQLQDYNQNSYELYPPLGHGPPDQDSSKLEQQPPKYDSQPVDFHSAGPASPSIEYPALGYQQQQPVQPAVKYGPVPASFGYLPPSHAYLPPSHGYLPAPAASPDIQLEISDHDITGFEAGGYAQRQPASGVHIVAMHTGPLKIPILSPDPAGGYFAGLGRNSIDAYPSGSTKRHLGYRPRLEIRNAIGYEVHRRRRDHSNAVRRI